MDIPSPAGNALQLLFKKLHPCLEDSAHALATGAGEAEHEKLHAHLVKARYQAADALAQLAEGSEAELAELLDELASALTPMGESYQQSLILTQLCLEEGPGQLLPFAHEGEVADSSWGKRMVAFLARLEDPAFGAHQRWKEVPPDLGEEGPEE